MSEKTMTAGVYRVFDEKTGDSYVGFTYNFEGVKKRLRFELTLNACSYKPLQLFWNERGELAVELLEAYVPDPARLDIEHDAYLRARVFFWQEKLGANTKLLQTQI